MSKYTHWVEAAGEPVVMLGEAKISFPKSGRLDGETLRFAAASGPACQGDIPPFSWTGS